MKNNKEEVIIADGQISIEEYAKQEFGAEIVKERDMPSDKPDYEVEIKIGEKK